MNVRYSIVRDLDWFGERVAALFTAEEILDIAGGRLASGMIGPEAGSICTDTRLIKEGEWFLALPGRQYDGHDFLGDAFAGGAIGAIVAERTGYSIGSHSFPLIAVPVPSQALSLLARNWRRRINPQMVVLCGESGELARLADLMRNAALAQTIECVCLSPCVHATQAATAILTMSETTKLVIVSLYPSALDQVERSAFVLEPNVLAFLPAAFDNLRLTSNQKDLTEAKASLMSHLNKHWGWTVSIDPAAKDDPLPEANRQSDRLIYPERFFDRPEWQKRGIGLNKSIGADYEKALAAAASRLSSSHAWLLIAACGLLGIAPSVLAEMFSR